MKMDDLGVALFQETSIYTPDILGDDHNPLDIRLNQPSGMTLPVEHRAHLVLYRKG